MEPANHRRTEDDRTRGIHGEEHGREIAGMGLKGVLAVEDGEAFVMGTP